MKKQYFSLFIGVLSFCQIYGQKQIVISNPSTNVRKELISIPYNKFENHFGFDSTFTIKDGHGKVLIHQLEKLGGSKPINVLIEVEMQPKERSVLSVFDEVSPQAESKTFARYVPERFDDFAWENNVVAFRMYGKSLEGKSDDAQGMDFWAKRTDDLVIDKWYKTEDYHKDHGQGLDYYSVGQSLGAGDMGLFIGDTLNYTKHYRKYKILDNGPIRSTFQLDFDPETVNGQTITITKQISIDASSQFNKITLRINNKEAAKTAIALGIVKRDEADPQLMVGKGNRTLSYWEPEINSSGKTGVALIVPNKKIRYSNELKKQALLISEVRNADDFTYYNGAAWDRAGKILNAEAWDKAVQQYNVNIQKPIKVQLK